MFKYVGNSLHYYMYGETDHFYVNPVVPSQDLSDSEKQKIISFIKYNLIEWKTLSTSSNTTSLEDLKTRSIELIKNLEEEADEATKNGKQNLGYILTRIWLHKNFVNTLDKKILENPTDWKIGKVLGDQQERFLSVCDTIKNNTNSILGLKMPISAFIEIDLAISNKYKSTNHYIVY